jgi:hypothetical protein
MNTEYKGKQRFTIHANDAGQEAYRDQYVDWLRAQLAAQDDLIAHQHIEADGLRKDRDKARAAAHYIAARFIGSAEPGERI